MPFAFVRPESRPWVAAAGTAEARVVDADRAALQLRSDYERWSRWGLGLLAFVLAAVGLFLALGMAGTIVMLGGTPHPLDIAVTLALAAIGLTATAVLIALQRSGRRLGRAAAFWLRLPYTSGGRARRASGWIEARTVNVEPRVFARIATASLALLLGIFGVSVLIRDLIEGSTSLTAAAAAVGVLGLAAGAWQFGGVLRLVSAVSERDPLWVRIRSRSRSE